MTSPWRARCLHLWTLTPRPSPHHGGDERLDRRALIMFVTVGAFLLVPLALEGVEAGYGDTVVLEGISLTLPAGGTLAVLGRNGVGKTTLLATITGHTLLCSGRISFAGSDVSTLPPY